MMQGDGCWKRTQEGNGGGVGVAGEDENIAGIKAAEFMEFRRIFDGDAAWGVGFEAECVGEVAVGNCGSKKWGVVGHGAAQMQADRTVEADETGVVLNL